MTTIPFVSQIKSLFQAVTGDLDGAKKTQEEFYDMWAHHTGQVIGDLADGVPIIGHGKGLVHFAMGDTEAGIRSEEAATRSTVVVAAGALTAGTGGVAAPILAGVVAGITADGVLTGIESARHREYDPQGLVAVGTNVVKDIKSGSNARGDIFDGLAIVVGDGHIGSSSVGRPVNPVKTKIFRVEGKSLVKLRGGEALEDFRAGDNQRVFYHEGQIQVRERLPDMTPAEDLSPNPPMRETAQPRYPRVRTIPRDNFRNLLQNLPSDASVFDDNGHMIFLNAGEEDRAYGYYAQKLIDHRQFVREYHEKLGLDRHASGVTEKTHAIRVKSFEVLTRDLEQIENDAITEAKKNQDPGSYKGVLKVDVNKAPRQYGLVNSRYGPIFNKHIANSFRSESLWIRHMPTPILRLIRDHPVPFGKVRRFRYRRAAAGATVAGNAREDEVVPIAALASLTERDFRCDDVIPAVLAHCRHVKVFAAPTAETAPESSEHYEYLVKFADGSPTEWYPEEFIAKDLQRKFYARAKRSARSVSLIKHREDGKLVVERPDGTVERVDDHQIFWDEQDPGTEQLSVSELDAILYHLHREDAHHGTRISLHSTEQFPTADVAHIPPATEKDGRPVYFASAVDFQNGVHPCKAVPSLHPACRVSYGGSEFSHTGKYDLLPFVPQLMELVPSFRAKVPPGRRPILGGYENKMPLYHAIGYVGDLPVPGKAASHLGGACIPYDGKEILSERCEILCWK